MSVPTNQPKNNSNEEGTQEEKAEVTPAARKLIIALIAVGAVLILLLVYSFLTRGKHQDSSSAPTSSNNVIHNQPTRNPTTATASPVSTGNGKIGGSNVNAQPHYDAAAASVANFCKAWATADQGKEVMLQNIKPYVTEEILEGLKDTDARNLTTDRPTLTNIVINPVSGTERTYNAYCVYNREPMPRYGGTFTSNDGSNWVLTEPNDPLTDPQVLPDNRPEPQRTSEYKLN